MWAPPGLLLAYLSADVAAAPHTSLAKAGGSDVWDNPWRVVLGALDGQGVRLIRGLRPYSINSLGSHLSTVCTIVSCALPAPGLSLGGTGRFRGAGMARRRRPEMNCSKNSKTRVRPQEDSPRSEAQCTLHSAYGPRLSVDLLMTETAASKRTLSWHTWLYYPRASGNIQGAPVCGKANFWKAPRRPVCAVGKFAIPEGDANIQRVPTCAKASIVTAKTRVPKLGRHSDPVCY